MKNSLTQLVSTAAGAAVFLLGTVGAAPAATMTTTIDFESGFVDFQPVDTIVAGGKQVTFSVGPGTTGGISPAFIAEVGAPATGFAPNDGGGTAIEAEIGSFFLTDQNPEAGQFFDYFIEFDQPASSLSVDLLDFRNDGGGIVGDTVTLTVFSDLFSTAIGSDTFIITAGLPDPNLQTLFVEVPGNLIQSASIVNSGLDGGTGIDNITFKMETVDVPESSSILGLLALGTLGVGSTLLRKLKRH